MYEKNVLKALDLGKIDTKQHPQTVLINKLTDISTQVIRQEQDAELMNSGSGGKNGERRGPREL